MLYYLLKFASCQFQYMLEYLFINYKFVTSSPMSPKIEYVLHAPRSKLTNNFRVKIQSICACGIRNKINKELPDIKCREMFFNQP